MSRAIDHLFENRSVPPGRLRKTAVDGLGVPQTRVLIAETDSATIQLLREFLGSPDFSVSVVNDGLSAVETARKGEHDVIISDWLLPGMAGLRMLSKLKSLGSPPEVIFISGQVAVEVAVEAIRMGASDFLSKPLRSLSVQEAVRRASAKRRIVADHNPTGRRVLRSHSQTLASSRSPLMQEIAQLVARVAKSNSTILITGDSGVGKEVIARSIHEESLRCNNTFTDISCAAIPETLLESELFGYEKGSFTGANAAKPGLFELANGGTLFLDEIGEIGPILQAKLLRVIETRSFYRVGGTKQITVDVRILVATNKDLKHEVEQGEFRKDLFYRLNTINIEVPPLRNHSDDIPLLIDQFMEEFDGTGQRRFSEAAKDALKRYPWPGNVRELRNVIERALLISPHMLIDVEDLPEDIINLRTSSHEMGGDPAVESVSLIEMEKKQIASVLHRTHWHRGRAADLLAISPKTLYRKIKLYELDKSVETL
jgi:two-component system response regulator AtoC